MVGIAGSEKKCNFLTQQLGFDAAINYNKQNMKVISFMNPNTWCVIQTAVRRAAPRGVDCYFDNVGGAISQVMLC